MIIKNKIFIFLIFVLPSILLALLGYYFRGIIAAVLVLLLFALISVTLYISSAKIILKWYHCEPIPSGIYVSIDQSLRYLSGKLSISVPELFIFKSDVPIIFSLGTRKGSKLVISAGLLELLNVNELESIIARELTNISEGNLAHNTFVAMLAGLVSSLSSAAMWISLLTGFGQEDDPAPRFIRFVSMGLVMLPAALLVYLGGSDRVLLIDAKAATILGEKYNLKSALKRMYTEIRLHSVEYFNPGHAQLFAVNPVKVHSLYDIHLSLFVAKPDMQQRLMALDGARSLD